MTIVASWFNLEKGQQLSIWTAADSKISEGEMALTLEGAKVFQLDVCCRSLGGRNWGEVVYRSSLVFAYSGSSISALNTYAALTTILSNLGAGGGDLRPDAISILTTAAKLLALYYREERFKANITISGFCPKSGKAFIGTIKPDLIDGSVEYRINVYQDILNTLNVVLIGSHMEEVKAKIDNLSHTISDKQSHKYWRTPITVLNDIICTNEFNEIGGGIQLVIINESYGFRHHAIINEMINEADFMYRNFNLFETAGTHVGECRIGLPGMDIGF